MKPRHKVTVKTTPHQSGSIPGNAITTGQKTGTQIMRLETASIKHPKRSATTCIRAIRTKGFSMFVTNVSRMTAERPVVAIMLAK